MTTLNIPIAKAGKGVTFAVADVEDLFGTLDPADQLEIIAAGLEKKLNSRMTSSKDYPAPSKLEGDEAAEVKTKALNKAEENLRDLKAGKLRSKGSTRKTTEKREVITEARRLAKEVVKNELRKADVKISHVKPSEITAAANSLIEEDPSFIAQAKANLAERTTVKSKIDIAALVKTDPALVAKAEKAKAERKAQLSAKQAALPKATGTKGGAKVPPRKPMTAAEGVRH